MNATHETMTAFIVIHTCLSHLLFVNFLFVRSHIDSIYSKKMKKMNYIRLIALKYNGLIRCELWIIRRFQQMH